LSFDLEMILRLLLAAVLGGVVGAERERMNRSAGLRTHALVSTASALIMIVSIYGFMQVIAPGRIVLDPSRIAAQVVSGVGFLGAGIIIFRKNAVRGLTTAASVWAVAAIGLAVGAGLYIVAIGATGILSVILTALKKVEKRFFPQKNITRLTVEFSSGAFNAVSDKLKRDGLKVLSMNVRTNKGINTLKVETIAEDKVVGLLFQDLKSVNGVDSVAYTGRILPVNDWVADELEEDGA
jgi:putative Mg2+ transporter-C (MgtC) family protein